MAKLPFKRTPNSVTRFITSANVVFSLFLASCNLAPNYVKPAVPAPPVYKDFTPESSGQIGDWNQARPQDDASRGKWWEVFGDPQLNSLEEQVNVSNQSVAAAAANFLAARALVVEARSQYFPTVGTNPSITNSRPSPAQFGGIGSGGSTFTVSPFTAYSLPFDASWQPDLWGRVRNTVGANTFSAQTSAADLQNVRLTAQAELAVDFFQVRTQDELKQLFDATVAAYQDSLELTQLQFRAGIASDEAVAQAETQLEATQAQDTNLGIARAQFEDAIALLVGQAAPAFSLAVGPLKANPPAIPPGVPSQLLERRPDIAAAERTVAQANSQIGVARAAYYPNVTLSATGGFGTTSIANWLTWPSRFWSVGPGLTETIFDAQLRKATVQQARALYDQNVANYRQTVLTAFGQVQDNLAALRILSQQIQQQDAAVNSAQRNLEIATERYRAGIDQYLNVITAQTTLLSNQQESVSLRRQQMIASVQLIEALGGGWNDSQLPSPTDIRTNIYQGPASPH